MRKRIYYSPDGSPPELPWLSTYCAEPETYEEFEIVPDEAWDKYEEARKQYGLALKELAESVVPPEPLNEEEIQALKDEFLSMTVEFSDETAVMWRRDLGHSVLAPKVYGEEFFNKHAMPWEAYQAYKASRPPVDESIFLSREEDADTGESVPILHLTLAEDLIISGCSDWSSLCVQWPYRSNGDYSSLRRALQALKEAGKITTDSYGFTNIKAV